MGNPHALDNLLKELRSFEEMIQRSESVEEMGSEDMIIQVSRARIEEPLCALDNTESLSSLAPTPPRETPRVTSTKPLAKSWRTQEQSRPAWWTMWISKRSSRTSTTKMPLMACIVCLERVTDQTQQQAKHHVSLQRRPRPRTLLLTDSSSTCGTVVLDSRKRRRNESVSIKRRRGEGPSPFSLLRPSKLEGLSDAGVVVREEEGERFVGQKAATLSKLSGESTCKVVSELSYSWRCQAKAGQEHLQSSLNYGFATETTVYVRVFLTN
jgi:hypothetical protein